MKNFRYVCKWPLIEIAKKKRCCQCVHCLLSECWYFTNSFGKKCKQSIFHTLSWFYGYLTLSRVLLLRRQVNKSISEISIFVPIHPSKRSTDSVIASAFDAHSHRRDFSRRRWNAHFFSWTIIIDTMTTASGIFLFAIKLINNLLSANDRCVKTDKSN